MSRYFAIGDIHGEDELLHALLAQIEPILQSGDTVVFMGDYVDRGPSVRKAIDEILSFKKRSVAKTVCLKGNHEEQMLDFLEHPTLFWLDDMEGWPTVESYLPGATQRHCQELAAGKPIDQQLLQTAERLKNAMPKEHIEFFDSLQLFFKEDTYLFVHAGVNMRVSWSEQTEEDLLWMDGRKLRGHWKGPETLIVGHKPTHRVSDEFWGKPILDDHFIMVDTGSGKTGVLTAVSLPDRQIYQARH